MATSRNTAVFELRTDTKDAVKDINKLDQDMTHLAETIGVEVSGSISAMEDRLYELALAGQQNTKEFRDLQAQTARYKQIVIETDRSIDQLAEQGRGLSTALGIAESTVAGFQAFTGVSALLGDENEELLETIVKLESAQGVLNSLMVVREQLQQNAIKLTQAQTTVQRLLNVAIGNGSKAMKLFRGALLATGIGAIIIGITALIQNFDKLRDMITGSSDDQRALNATMEDYKKGAEDAILETNKVETAFKLAKDGVISKEEALDTYNETLGDAFGKTKDLEEAERLFNEKADAYMEAMAKRAQANALFAKSAEISAQGATAEFEDNRSFIQKWGTSLLKTYGFVSKANEVATQQQIDATEEIKKSSAEQSEAILKLGQDKLKEAEETEEANGIKGESDKKYAEEARKRREKEEQDLLKLRQLQSQQLNSLLDQIAQEEEDFQNSAKQKEINAVRDHYYELIEKAKEYGQDVTILTEARDAKVFAIEEKYRKMTQDAIDKANELRLNEEEELDEIIRQAENRIREGKNADRAQELEDLNTHYFNLIERAKAHGLDTEALLAEQKLKEAEIEEKYRKEQEQKDKESLQKRSALYTAHLDTLSGGLESLNNLNDLVTTIQMERAEGNEAKQEAIQKKSFERNKKIQIALATIQGIQGVINALTAESVLPEPFGSIQKAVQATVVATATASNIAKIKATKFQGGGSVSAGGGGGVQGASASSFSIGDDTSSAQTMLNPDGTQSQSGNGQAVQVFVTETDISNVQQNVQQIDVRSTF